MSWRGIFHRGTSSPGPPYTLARGAPACPAPLAWLARCAHSRYVLALALLCGAPSLLARETVDYDAIFKQGISYDAFLKDVRARRDEWRALSAGPGAMYDIKNPHNLEKRRLLIVTEDWCSDSVQTVPYIHLALKNHPAYTIRIVNSTVGRPIMEAHRTPDDREATPTTSA